MNERVYQVSELRRAFEARPGVVDDSVRNERNVELVETTDDESGRG